MPRQAAVQRLADDPGFLLSRVGAAVRAGFQEVLARRGLRPLQYMILLILDAGSGVSQQQLCEATGIDSGNMVDCSTASKTWRTRRGPVIPATAAATWSPSPGADNRLWHGCVRPSSNTPTAFSARSPRPNVSN
ncbi:MAG TPA: MarR family winged helix-turn-helix transcriptional regulator [Streptosporangiaceae bacterium]|nr:MarR family winged helix-turn-helix transcriptional regulator [Streptosporangiaceae bacterium]